MVALTFQLTICACTLLLYLKSSANKCYMLVISKEAIVCNNRSVRIKCNQTILQMVYSDHMPLNGIILCLQLINHMQLSDIKLMYCIHCISVTPCSVGLLWLHDVIICLPPPHAHSEMPPSVSSTHSSKIQDKNLFYESV